MQSDDARGTAVVTGAARGLGASIARAFHIAGYRVCLTDIDAAGAADVARALDSSGRSTIGLRHDARSEEDFRRVLKETESALGAPVALVNNAGTTLFGAPEDITVEEFTRGTEVNMLGAFLGCKVFGRYFAERRNGRIINIASLAGQNGGTASAVHYAAAKAGVLALTKVFARQLGGAGVAVNAIAPGPLDLPSVHATVPAERLAALASGMPSGALLSPEFVGRTAVLLADPLATSVSGACWDINGGLNMR